MKKSQIVLYLLTLLSTLVNNLPADNRPNVLIILADDLGYSDLSCYGSEIPTPNLDKVAANGTRFKSFYTSARCCPSRASLMTGLHPHQAGIGSFTFDSPRPNMGPAFTGHLLPNCVTLAEILGDAGYSTWMVGKWHIGIPGPIKRGFQNYYGFKNFLAHSEDQWDQDKYVRLPQDVEPELQYNNNDFYVTDVFSDYVCEFLSQAEKQDKPFFMYLAYSSPHFPVQAPKETIDKYYNTYMQGWDKLRAERLAKQKKLGLFGPEVKLPPRSLVPVDRDDIANGYAGKLNPAWDDLELDRQKDLARRMATFAAMVEHVDQGVGRVVEQLKKSGKLDNTLILFLSDNGACYEWGPFGFDGTSRAGYTRLHKGTELDQIGQFGTHHSYGSAWANLGNTPLNMYKHYCHEGGLSSPLIFSWPKMLKNTGRWINDPAHLMDIVPTILEATGAEYPEYRNMIKIQPMEGVSLLNAAKGNRMETRMIPFDHQGAHGLRWGKWKIVWSKRQPTPVTWELYDLDIDPSEQINLAGQHPDLVKKLVTDWEKWAVKVGVEGYWKDTDTSDASPEIANKEIHISVEANPDNGGNGGVIIAHGGNRYGYAVYISEGKAVFDVRIDGKITSVTWPEPVSNKVRIEAVLAKDIMSISVNNSPAIEIDSPGLIPVQPLDPMTVGEDTLSAAGNYYTPNKFEGTVIYTRIIADGNPPAVMPAMSKKQVRDGLKSHNRALYVLEGWIRDPYIIKGPDNYFYLTGTTPNPGDPREQSDPYNTGLGDESLVGWKAQVWRSKNLVKWEYLGTPFTLQDGIWYTDRPERFNEVDQLQWRLWAPELHWLGDRWALVHTSPSPVNAANLALSNGSEVAGPWENPMGTKIKRKHDPSLFKDDDGTWWMIWGATEIAPLKPDFSDFAGPSIRIRPAGDMAKMGHEGCLIQKIHGKYVLFGTGWSTTKGRRGSYNLYYATADKITGPYSERKFAGRFLGHGTPFQDNQGRWWCTAFYNGNVPPVSSVNIQSRDLSTTAYTINQRGTTLVPLEVKLLDNGELYIRAKDPAYAVPGPDEYQKF